MRRRAPSSLPPLLLLALLGFAFATSGCEPYPRDPNHTLVEIERQDVLWVGVCANPPWVRIEDERLSGVEVDLVEGLADAMDVEVRWLVLPESKLIEALKHGEIDLAIAGFTAQSPWRRHVALTNPYVTVDKMRHVMAVPAGENRWLMRVEAHLRGKGERILRELELTPVEPREVQAASLGPEVLR